MKTNRDLFADTQLELLDLEPQIRLKTHAAARNLYGSQCERIAVEALGLRRLKISGSFDACYDAQSSDGRLIEIKSVKRSGSCPIWIWRMKKDIAACEEGNRVYYVFVTHNCSGVLTSDELWRGMSETVKEIYVVPAQDVAKLHAAAPFGGMKLGIEGRSVGYAREGYRDGYRRVSMKSIRALCQHSYPAAFVVAGQAFHATCWAP